MSTFQFPGLFYISDNYDSTTGSGYFLSVQGDTVRLLSQRTISSSSDPGYTGEFCTDGSFLYYCILGDGTNTGSTWVRTAFSSF
jgi:hypothetical protein